MTRSAVSPSVATIQAGGHILVRTKTLSAREHSLSILSEPVVMAEDLEARHAHGELRARLHPATPPTFYELMRADEPMRDRILALKDGEDIPREEFRFFTCSWSPRKPKRLSVRSRPVLLGKDAYLLAAAEAKAHAGQDDIYFVLRLLDPAPVGAAL